MDKRENDETPYAAPRSGSPDVLEIRRPARELTTDIAKGVACMTLLGVPAFIVLCSLGQVITTSMLGPPLSQEESGDLPRSIFIWTMVLSMLFSPCAVVIGALIGACRPFVRMHRRRCFLFAAALALAPLIVYAVRAAMPGLYGLVQGALVLSLPAALPILACVWLFARDRPVTG